MLRPDQPLSAFLAASEVVDADEPAIVETAKSICSAGIEPRQALFEWVRDCVVHSCDFGREEVTCRATDVLRVGTGLCYAKAHLLVALLRSVGVPAGFCYQTFREAGDKRDRLHGLVGLQLPSGEWVRLDPRGNTVGIGATYDLTSEHRRLAFPNLPFTDELIHAEPYHEVIRALESATTISEISSDLPFLE